MGYSQPAQIINKTFEVANEKSREGTEKFITAYKEKKKQDFPHNPTRVDEEKKKQEEEKGHDIDFDVHSFSHSPEKKEIRNGKS